MDLVLKICALYKQAAMIHIIYILELYFLFFIFYFF